MQKVGCLYGTSNELIEKAYRDSERYGKEYEKCVHYVEHVIERTEKKNTLFFGNFAYNLYYNICKLKCNRYG